ncbi:MAG: hypothetical protein A2550_00300 [Candidatus Jacksonbacteria bacterium RIFOXYD2_FULL_43_21]|nr:MAG: hypothetical protein A2240_05425 [Candidatus Jacksonbacteria bacterium RIFOXYA2_FULL_43_12]OGY82122.1 MAG: hypothetical protein A2550_00300 [Candidatus Jacksonbacteria bacterium RIFOXYD2_FULL_43_21]
MFINNVAAQVVVKDAKVTTDITWRACKNLIYVYVGNIIIIDKTGDFQWQTEDCTASADGFVFVGGRRLPDDPYEFRAEIPDGQPVKNIKIKLVFKIPVKTFVEKFIEVELIQLHTILELDKKTLGKLSGDNSVFDIRIFLEYACAISEDQKYPFQDRNDIWSYVSTETVSAFPVWKVTVKLPTIKEIIVTDGLQVPPVQNGVITLKIWPDGTASFEPADLSAVSPREKLPITWGSLKVR